jgi:hypothetical protein
VKIQIYFLQSKRSKFFILVVFNPVVFRFSLSSILVFPTVPLFYVSSFPLIVFSIQINTMPYGMKLATSPGPTLDSTSQLCTSLEPSSVHDTLRSMHACMMARVNSTGWFICSEPGTYEHCRYTSLAASLGSNSTTDRVHCIHHYTVTMLKHYCTIHVNPHVRTGAQ